MGNYSTRIRDWPEHERPRERLVNQGAAVLSEAELLAILLRTGNGKQSAIELARCLLNKFAGLRGLDAISIEELKEINGIGLAKAAQIKAAMELAKRLARQKWRAQDKISCSGDVYDLVHLRMRDLKREEFWALYLTSKNEIITERKLFEGTLTESIVSPREVIVTAVQQAAAFVILLHNHPSGHPFPSREDKLLTEKLVKACAYAEIKVLDHVIIGKDSYFSFADQGLIQNQ